MATDSKIGTEDSPLRVAVIGSGPSGFYAASALLKQNDHAVWVDVFDRLPTPYGLVRGGVAPDHQKIKTVTRVFEKSALRAGFRYFGHVELGRDVQVRDLLPHYHQIVYAVGNEDDRRMGIPGEYLIGCTPATVFVGWYNAHPDYRNARFDWNSKRIAVVGNGNVAVDVARILAKGHDELARTDIADYALEALDRSQAEEIVMLGRRGPLQAAFTPAELQELAELESAALCVGSSELELDPESRAELEAASPRSNARRNYEILSRTAFVAPKDRKHIRLRFLVSPVEIVGDEQGRARRIRLEKNRLVRDRSGSLRARGTGEFEALEVDWVFVSIGYEGRRIAGIPFDEERGAIANVEGRVCDASTKEVVPNQYVVGWAKSGPRGLIGMHKAASAAVVKLMLEDVAAGSLKEASPIDGDSITRFLDNREVRYVTFDDWKIIDAAEVARGKRREAPRVKFSQIPEMLDALEKDDSG
jgi:ferredoxin--NADP+ reductase